MYKRILLAFDGSVEGRTALREGALLAKSCGAQVHLLSVVSETGGMAIGEGAFAGAVALHQDRYREVLEEGAARLRAMG
ncbi:universal stress protein, partial [Phenylobacterium soli]